MTVLGRLAVLACCLVLAPVGGPAAPAAPSGGGSNVLAYPAAQTIPPSGRLPQGGSRLVTINAAIGEREGAWLVATNAQNVTASVDGSALGSVRAQVYFGHFVSFGGRAVPDAL